MKKFMCFAREIISVIYRQLCLSSYCTSQLVPKKKEEKRMCVGGGVDVGKQKSLPVKFSCFF